MMLSAVRNLRLHDYKLRQEMRSGMRGALGEWKNEKRLRKSTTAQGGAK
jgi:hypothetical protein